MFDLKMLRSSIAARFQRAAARAQSVSSKAKTGIVVGTTRPDVAILVIPGLFFVLVGAMVILAPRLMLALVATCFLFVGALFCFVAYKYVEIRKRIEKSLRGMQAQVLVSRPANMAGGDTFFGAPLTQSGPNGSDQASQNLAAAEMNLTENRQAELEEFMGQLALSSESDMTDSQRRRVAKMLREIEVKKIILH